MDRDRIVDHSSMKLQVTSLINQTDEEGLKGCNSSVYRHYYHYPAINQPPVGSDGFLTCAGNGHHLFELPRPHTLG